MARSLVCAVLISILAVPLLAKDTGRSSTKGRAETGPTSTGSTGQGSKKAPPPTGQAGAGGNNPAGQAGQEKPGEKKLTVLPRAKIVGMASDGSQIIVVETFRFKVEELFPEQPVLRPGEVVCPQFTSDGKVKSYGFDDAKPCTGPPSMLYTFESFDPTQKRLKLAKSEQVLNVPEGVLRDRVKEIGVGSIPTLEVEPGGDRGTVRHIGIPRVEIPGPWRFWAMFLACALLVIFAGLTWGRLAGGKGFYPFAAFLGKDNLYSNSKFQAALWFGVLIVTYLPTLIFRWLDAGFVGGVSIPTNLLLMSGLSAVTFAGAKAIKQSQAGQAETQAQAAERQAHLATIAATASTQAEQAAGGVPAPQIQQTAAMQQVAATSAQNIAQQKRAVAKRFDPQNAQGVPRFWFDLTHDDDGTPSLSKFQLVVIVLIAVGIYLFQAWDFLAAVPLQAKITLPDVDNALLTAFGLGQGAYLGVKFAGDGQ
ncbi:MAG TPA: hypothetical protein VGH73_10630 [Thermoanaerobaculia bacterium]|jgi:hypothetical protein